MCLECYITRADTTREGETVYGLDFVLNEKVRDITVASRMVHSSRFCPSWGGLDEMSGYYEV